MQTLRTHTCYELTSAHVGQEVVLMGWVHVKRNLGGVIFIDLRDHHGLTQVVIHPDAAFYSAVVDVRAESVIEVKGPVIRRQGAINPKLKTGEIEVAVRSFRVEAHAQILPFPVAHNPKQEHEDTRLRYRFLDLRTEKMHRNISFYSQVTRALRDEMHAQGFIEFQTPILTSSSPEGARDFLVPSRLHPGKFYALPQAPQQFKQLLMCSGFDRYFQIAPCFRDEDPRSDRAPGEFYQLDIEMAFVTQDLVFAMGERLVGNLWDQFGGAKKFEKPPFRRLAWREALSLYGSDKPDLRFGLELADVSEIFTDSSFGLFASVVQQKGVLRAMRVVQGSAQSRKFFDETEAFAKEQGLLGLPWLAFKDGQWKGSVAKVLVEEEKRALVTKLGLLDGDALIFVLGAEPLKVLNAGGKVRLYLGDKLGLRRNDEWSFVWIVDFPMYEWNDDEKKVDFCHNPFSMPQGGMASLEHMPPLDVLAHQYDLVCNGYELASGAIRNHRKDIMQKAFAVAGYSADEVESRFGALWTAFAYGAPPHGGMAFGLARIVMLLLDEPNIREVLAFPMNGRAMDLLMGAPSQVSGKQLKEAHIATLS